MEKEFSGYFDLFNELTYDKCFMFIYKNIKDLKASFILRQIESSIEEVKEAYSVNENYVNKIIEEIIFQIKVLAGKKLEELPKEEVSFFPGFHNNFEPLYKDLINRIEYLFEIRRNTKKLFSERNGKKNSPYYF